MNTVAIKMTKKKLSIVDMVNNDKETSISRKDLICTVCGAPATGFNFAVITCMCCKAFFRRNALFGLPSLQCRYLSENCSINMKTRRDCSYCRLKKCFEVGMKKELILTDELKRVKREKIIANRQMTLNLIRPIDTLTIKCNNSINSNHSNFVRNIYNAFDEYCYRPLIIFDKTEYELICHQPIKSRIKIQHYYQYFAKHSASLMDFFRCIPELKKFSETQQLTLCQHNMRLLIRISLIETKCDDLPLWPAINLLIETVFGKNLLEEADIVLQIFKQQISNSTCIRLLLVILLFSTHISFNDCIDTLCVYRIQAKYTEFLWLYLMEHYDYFIVCEKFSIITRHILHLQTIGHLADLKREEMQRSQHYLVSE
ncbi:hypothetical protein I4U23_006773 [Adineta vaga]|nr:hypothetical protein I4U23_006773 [Adineta vaga]